MLLGTGFSAYVIPDSAYESNWKTPKFFDTQAFLYVIYASAAFAAGGILVVSALPRAVYLQAELVMERLRLPWRALRIIFYLAIAVILLAYAIWLAVLTHQGGVSLGVIAAGVKGDAHANYQIKGSGETLPGVTTLVQLAAGLFILGFILIFKFGWRRSLFPLILPLIFILFVTWLRSRLWSERLAVLELLVPSVLLSFRLAQTEKWKWWVRGGIASAPLLAPALLFFFFSAAEYSRSWISYYRDTQDSFFLFSFMRLVGYYVTALNNGALAVLMLHHYDVPFSTFDWFWKLPPVRALLPYESVGNIDPTPQYLDLLQRFANPEFNNPSGIFLVRLDYGYIGGLVAWFGFGVVAMLLYRGFIKGSLTGLLLYPFFFTGLLESPRVFYWGAARTLPTWGLLFFIIALALVTSQTLRPPRQIREGIVRRPRGSLGPVLSHPGKI